MSSKERLLNKNSLMVIGIAAGIGLSGAFFDRMHRGTPTFLESWSDPGKNVAIVENDENFDVFTRDNRHAVVPGQYETYWKDKDYFSVGGRKDDQCFVAIFRNSGSITIIQDYEINAYRIIGINDRNVTYYRMYPNFYDIVSLNLETQEKVINDRHYIGSSYLWNENSPC